MISTLFQSNHNYYQLRRFLIMTSRKDAKNKGQIKDRFHMKLEGLKRGPMFHVDFVVEFVYTYFSFFIALIFSLS